MILYSLAVINLIHLCVNLENERKTFAFLIHCQSPDNLVFLYEILGACILSMPNG